MTNLTHFFMYLFVSSLHVSSIVMLETCTEMKQIDTRKSVWSWSLVRICNKMHGQQIIKKYLILLCYCWAHLHSSFQITVQLSSFGYIQNINLRKFISKASSRKRSTYNNICNIVYFAYEISMNQENIQLPEACGPSLCQG
jgi:hypothetical protein